MTPADELDAARRLRARTAERTATLEQQASTRIAAAIDSAHRAGWSYDQIAARLGMTRQGMSQRYR